MHPSAWLEAAFGSEARVRILRVLSGSPGRARTERELAVEIAMSSNAVNKAVRSLRDAGFVTVESVGRAHAVRLSREPGLVEALRSVFGVEDGTWAATRERIRASIPPDAACYLFGSSARRSARADSDVDLLVVARDRDAAAGVACALYQDVQAGFPLDLNIIALGIAEARARLRRDGVVREAVAHGELMSRLRIDELLDGRVRA